MQNGGIRREDRQSGLDLMVHEAMAAGAGGHLPAGKRRRASAAIAGSRTR